MSGTARATTNLVPRGGPHRRPARRRDWNYAWRQPSQEEGASLMSSRPRWRFWEKQPPPAEPAPPAPPKTLRPPRWQSPPLADPAQQQKLDQLRRRRETIVYDLERAEAARVPDNPWQERIALLDES